ncbi:MAG: hypothetical protein FWG10_01440 [Eubacteriaceae bacterium]|nr:hypothetical protein [Eubacteriaceae bacterium]
MQKTLFSVVICFTVILFGVIQVAADTFIEPVLFEILSDDGTMMFRWDPGSKENWSHMTAQAGVYRNGELVYAVDNLPILGESESNFFFSSDFKCFIHMPTANFEVALRYYSNGKLEKTYYINDLVKNTSNVAFSEDMAFWRDTYEFTNSAVEYFTQRNILRVMTIEGVVHWFDLLSGKILSSSREKLPPYPPGILYDLSNDQIFGFSGPPIISLRMAAYWLSFFIVLIVSSVLQAFAFKLPKIEHIWSWLILFVLFCIILAMDQIDLREPPKFLASGNLRKIAYETKDMPAKIDPYSLERLDYAIDNSTNCLTAKLVSREHFVSARSYTCRYRVVENLVGNATGEIIVIYGYGEPMHRIGEEACMFLSATESALYPHTVYTPVEGFKVKDGTATIRYHKFPIQLLVAKAQKANAKGHFGKDYKKSSVEMSESQSLQHVYMEADFVLEATLVSEWPVNEYVSMYEMSQKRSVKGPAYVAAFMPDTLLLSIGLELNVPYCILLKEDMNYKGEYLPFSRSFIAIPTDSMENQE